MSLKEYTLQLAYKMELEKELSLSPEKRNINWINVLNSKII